MIRVMHGDCRDVLATLPAESVQCVVTSPPYFGLRSYLPECHSDKHLEIGAEPTPDDYVAQMVAVFREIRRVLRSDGTCWLNIGDSYNGGGVGGGQSKGLSLAGSSNRDRQRGDRKTLRVAELKPKDLLQIPARVTLALQADGWWLRSEVVWHKCLSGGTRVYARTQKGEMPMTIKDLVRLDPATVQLWNGTEWTQCLRWSETERPDITYEIELRNGQRIGCTGNHVWPTERGNIRTDQLRPSGGLFPADAIQTCELPEPSHPVTPDALDDEMVGWFVGLYIAEGSQCDGTIQIASHVKENERFDRLSTLAEAFHGTAAVHKTSENGCTVALNGPILCALVETYVSGRIASDKHLGPRCWRRSNRFLRAVLDGYLSGDGHWDEANNRWRLGFCNNDELVANLRTLAARLGVSLRLKRVVHSMGNREFPGYKGEVRFERSAHYNNKPNGEVVSVRESRARKFWDISVADEPHLFALASGVLTHNSNPMPESVTDRPTCAHEKVFLLTKSATYFYDSDAVREDAESTRIREVTTWADRKAKGEPVRRGDPGQSGHIQRTASLACNGTRNLRNVWTIATQPYSGAHFATMPPELAETCIKAGTSERGRCPTCGAPWERVVERSFDHDEADRIAARRTVKAAAERRDPRYSQLSGIEKARLSKAMDLGWRPTCACPVRDPVPCVVLDPFSGAGTTLLVASRLGRSAIGIELNPAYCDMASTRVVNDCPLFTEVA